MDLVFPHHENERAQSQAAGDGFARYWLHNAWVTVGGQKMGKSLGNALLIRALLRDVRPVELRYYLSAAHYRSMIEYSPEALAEAATGYRRIESFVKRATEVVGPAQPPAALPDGFTSAMEDDLGVPAALAVMHNLVSTGNSQLSSGSVQQLPEILGQVRAMAAILGFDPDDSHWSTGADAYQPLAGALVEDLLQQRRQARQERDFATADAIRARLTRARRRNRGRSDRHPLVITQGGLMAGNSSRRGAVRGTGSKKGATVGSGGQRRKGLQAAGPTPRAEDRPGHPAARRSAAAARNAGKRSPGRASTADVIAGRNAVREALEAGVPARELYVLEEHRRGRSNPGGDRDRQQGRSADHRRAPRVDLDRKAGTSNHQGLALIAAPFNYVDVTDLPPADASPLVIALDHLTDPHNLGAIARSGAAFGASGMVLPQRRSASVTAAAWKASAGALARLPVARVGNLVNALNDLKRKGYFVIGLDAAAPDEVSDLSDALVTGAVVLVVGAEGSGLSRLVAGASDALVRINMPGGSESLNASVATGIALHELARRR